MSKPTYRAKAHVFVSTQGGDTIGELTQGSTFTQQRVKSYVDLASSPRLLKPVIDSLALPSTPEALAEQVRASSPLDTVLINIAVSHSNPDQARDIANAIADTYPLLVAELETPPGEAKGADDHASYEATPALPQS